MLPKKLVGLTLLVSGLFMNISALPLFSGDVLGKWDDVISTDFYDYYRVSNFDAVSTADFNWGTPVFWGIDNQFSFNGLSFTDVEEDTPFSIGTFAYRNGSTFRSVGIEGVDLSIALSFSNPVSSYSAFDFGFKITNTPNLTGNPYEDGDSVSVINGLSSSTFNYSGIDYTLNLLGFSSDGGTTIRTDFNCPENAIQQANLYAQITADIQKVSEPGTISLLLMGFLTLGSAMLMRKKRDA